MKAKFQRHKKYVEAISRSRLSIYDNIEICDQDLWIPTEALEVLLDDGLKGKSLSGLPIRTRSKNVKEAICKILGYPIPESFKKTRPRFPGQQFDTYIQKARNLQIWNEEIDPSRRYVLIIVSNEDIIERVKVLTGEILVKLDRTGTLTQKYQARVIPDQKIVELVVSEDTENLQAIIKYEDYPGEFEHSPISYPTAESLLPIDVVFERLKSLVGHKLRDLGYDQERNRGAELHKLVCMVLGYKEYQDDGRFPDIRNQLLEVKLQTSPTIDLGLVCPNSKEPLGDCKVNGREIRHCDVRYAIFYATTDGKNVELRNFYLTTGEAFFQRFEQFKGKGVNKKIQIPLPNGLFS